MSDENKMAKKLTYFSINGLAEAIRYILHYNKEDFEDVWMDRNKWFAENLRDSAPYGQLPIYEEGGRKLNQSIAIARYVGHRAGLVPLDVWEQAVLDAAVLNVNDFMLKLRSCFSQADQEKKDAMINEFLEVTLDFYFSRFEKELERNNGHFGGKLSWADFYLIGAIETTNYYLNKKIESTYPTVSALVEKIRNLPGVKEYIAKRRPYKF